MLRFLKNKLLLCCWFLLVFLNHEKVIADNWLFNWISWNIKEWDIHLADVPVIIGNAIWFGMWIAWTIAIIFVIIWAYKTLFGSLSWDKSKWKETMIMAVGWFVLAALAWLIMKFIFTNFN